MTPGRAVRWAPPGRTLRTVLLLAAQALSFGIAEAFLIIPANGVFLTAYGAEWLPLTYIGIAALGTGASVLIARSLRRWALPAVSVVILGATAATLLVTWFIIATTGAAWPSAVQLLLFPILIQLGFVIIGGQAGRLLDLQQIKHYFPRIVSGFVVGFTVGGFAAAPLIDIVGAEHIVIVSAASFVVFLVLVQVAATLRPAELTVVDRPADDRPRPPLRAVLTGRLVVLIFVYQVLSAMGSQVVEFLAFDRAAARYEDVSDLTRFMAIYTGVLNLVDLAFLWLAAGWLLRRFGLRLGLAANPVIVMLFAVAMVAAAAGPGAASLAMFSLAVTTRIVDIALTDGTTRTSINAVYQVLPVEERLAVQAAVEGIGVPIAIGATGVLLLVMNALELGTAAVAVFALVLCAVWSAAAFVAYSDYRRALAARLRRRGLDLASVGARLEDEQTAVRRLLLTDDVRDVRLGLELAVTANVSSADLAQLAGHADADVRLLALGQLARRGDLEAAGVAAAVVHELAGSADVVARRAAALALADVYPADRQQLLSGLMRDADASVRAAALASIGAHDVALVGDVADRLDDAATAESARVALERLGGPALALVAERVAGPGPVPARFVHVLRSIETTRADALMSLEPLVTHSDRGVSVAALTALARHGASPDDAVLERLLGEDAHLAGSALAASVTMTTGDEAMLRALDDVIVLVRERVLAVLAVRHGTERIDGARAALSSTDSARRALGVEMLLVSISRREAVVTEAVVRDDVPESQRLRRLRAVTDVPVRDRAAWLADLVLDPDRRWSSPWLQAVALHTELQSDPAAAARHAEALRSTDHPALAEGVLAAS